MEGDDVGPRFWDRARVVWLIVFGQVSRNPRFPSGGAREWFREWVSIADDLLMKVSPSPLGLGIVW